MTRREFHQVGAPLSERSSSYLEDCQDADIWSHMAVTAIGNYAALMRAGMLDQHTALHMMLALSDQE